MSKEKKTTKGSRTDHHDDSSLVIDEEVEKILGHMQAKLPPEVLSKLDIMGGIKSKLHNYYNQSLQNMLNRYLVTVEDEFAKKYTDLLQGEEQSQTNRYTTRQITELMSKLGGDEMFNTEMMEKSVADVYRHMQEHIERGINRVEHQTKSLLEQKEEVGAFIRQDNAYAIVKCSFKNNPIKPKTVVDIKLAINILDSELITPIYHYQHPAKEILKEIISDHIHQQIDSEIAELALSQQEQSGEVFNDSDLISQKLAALENHLAFDDDAKNEKSKRYDLVAKRFLDSLDSMQLDASSEEDVFDLRSIVKSMLERDHFQNKGFNKAVNCLTTILDRYQMGYQYIDNLKNGRICVIREYANTNKEEQPDETFAIRLNYFDMEQINELRHAYDLQAEGLVDEIKKTAFVIEKAHDNWREDRGIRNYKDISFEVLGQQDENLENEKSEAGDKLWNDMVFFLSNSEENQYKTNLNYSKQLKKQLSLMRGKVAEMYGNQHPRDRQIMEGRLDFLSNKFQEYVSRINPHHLQPGLTLEIDITSVKRQRTTMSAVSNVLNEFLHNVSKKFNDQAIEDFN
ncbi:MAG: cytochrome c oxidase subunit II, partial [Proteobacteria bacterium]|nr:cytochrome c oxidase subunit II [Pseudomonadota bacterium]